MENYKLALVQIFREKKYELNMSPLIHIKMDARWTKTENFLIFKSQ